MMIETHDDEKDNRYILSRQGIYDEGRRIIDIHDKRKIR